MSFIVATNGVARRQPERQLTGTPHACANYQRFVVFRINIAEYVTQMVFKKMFPIQRIEQIAKIKRSNDQYIVRGYTLCNTYKIIEPLLLD